MVLTTKRATFLFLSERQTYLSLVEKNILYVLFALPNASEKNKKIAPFDYMKNGSITAKRATFLFLSERHLLSRKERYLYFLPCQMHQKKKKNPFDYMKNGSHHKKSNFFVRF